MPVIRASEAVVHEIHGARFVSYANSAAHIQRQIADEDDALIHPASHTRLWAHGKQTPRAILYLHGYTDSTQQLEEGASQVVPCHGRTLGPTTDNRPGSRANDDRRRHLSRRITLVRSTDSFNPS